MEILKVENQIEVESKNKIKGIASHFGSMIAPNPYPSFFFDGSWKKTIAERFSTDPKKNKVRILYMHNDSEILGRPLELYESKNEGLRFTAEIVDTSRGRDAMKLIRAGAINEVSVGFDSVKQHVFDYKHAMNFLDGLEREQPAHRETFNRIRAAIHSSNGALYRFIEEARLWEISLVSWGADSQTSVEAASHSGMMADEGYKNSDLESALNYARSRSCK